MRKICKNCKHWDEENDDTGIGIDLELRQCKKVQFLWDCTESDQEGKHTLKNDDLAFSLDWEDYRAYFLTKENFGCVQFTNKTDEDKK